MTVAYSTTNVHPRDRTSYWVEAVARTVFRQDIRFPNGCHNAAMRAGSLGRLRIATCRGDACEIERSPRDTRDGADSIALSIRHAGRSVSHHEGSEIVHDAGTMVLIDATRPMRHFLLSPMSSMVISMPREALTARLGNAAAFCARPISAGAPTAGLASEFASLLAGRLDSLEQATGDRLAEQALDLIALAFATELGQAHPALSSPRATALLRLKAAIDARLSDPGLKPAKAAAAAGVSVRYANDLLAEENFSLERYILHRRLERCRSALADPLQAHRMVGEIAFSWGFSDHSHFTRSFRRAFGMSPGDCRRQERRGG